MSYWVLSKRIKVTNTTQVGSSCQSSSCSKFSLVLKLFPSWIHKALLLSLKGTSIYWELLRCSRYWTEVIACNPQTFAQTHRSWTQKEMDQVKSEARMSLKQKIFIEKEGRRSGAGLNFEKKKPEFCWISYEWILFESHEFVAWEIVTISTDILFYIWAGRGLFSLLREKHSFPTTKWVSRWSLSWLLKTDSI